VTPLGGGSLAATAAPWQAAVVDETLVRALLDRSAGLPGDDLKTWWGRAAMVMAAERTSFERAVRGGLLADRAGVAFAAGYQAAIHSVFPALPALAIGSLCVTEKAGGHPKNIEAALEPSGAGWTLRGEKRWSSMAPVAQWLMVVAREPGAASIRPRLRVATVPAARRGVHIKAMAPTSFAPEIPHAEISFDGVELGEDEVAAGDGFEQVVRPFRTVEDIHVLAALAAFVTAEAGRFRLGDALREPLFALLHALEGLAREPPSSPQVHLALAGLFPWARRSFEALEGPWLAADPGSFARWERDRPLLTIAEPVRQKRTEAAWQALAGHQRD
jgi:alkylation response protein AidB-like acyl-CoA dehydrogenase